MKSFFVGCERFGRDTSGIVGAIFGLSFVPMVMFTGAAVDFGRASLLNAQLQAAVDQAALSASLAAPDQATRIASSMVQGTLAKTGYTITTSAVADPTTNAVTVTSSVDMPNTFMSLWMPSLTLSRSSRAQPGSLTTTSGGDGMIDDSCIFTMGETLTISTDTMTFNGSPSVNLTGCSLRSNKSMKCNGGSTGANSYAVGEIVGCSNPHPAQAVTPDIYNTTASNISLVCGGLQGSTTWLATTSGGLPTGANVKSVARTGYTEIHICGNLVVAGSASMTLTGATPAQDTVVVIERGGLMVASNSVINANRTTFVLASGGGSGFNPIVSWPNGNGGNSSSMTLSASIDPSNPWRGMAIFQSPWVNYGADMYWNSGTTFTVDGIIYMPNAELTVSGQVYSGPGSCSKLVVGEFTLNGAVNLKQSAQGCADMQVTQYTIPPTQTVVSTGALLLQ